MKNPTVSGLLIAGSVAAAAVGLLVFLCTSSNKAKKEEAVQP